MTEKKNYYIYKWEKRFRKPLEGAYRITVSIRDLEEEDCRETLRELRAAGTQVYCVLSVLWKIGQGPAFEQILPEIDGWYAGNIGQIEALLKTGKPVMGDAGLNVFNVETVTVLKEMGMSGVTWSYELDEGIRCLLPPVDLRADGFQYEILRSGRIPAMVSEYCPLAGAEGIRGTGCGRCREENPVWLKDFKGERYPVLLEPEGCTALILSRKPLDRPESDALAEERDDVIRRICM